MRKILAFFMLVLFIFTGCKKSDNSSTSEVSSPSGTKEKTATISPEKATQYAIQDFILVYTKKDDVGKSWNDMKDKDATEYFWLNVGNKVNVIEEGKANSIESYLFELPDGTKYWVEKKFLTDKFITINKENTLTYSQPDQDYLGKVKLQIGDFGIFKEEKNGFYLVEFRAYQPLKEGDPAKYVGEVWINSNDGWTDDVNTAKEAYYLYLATFYDTQKNDQTKAIENLNKALEINGGSETAVTPVIQEYLANLEQL